MLNCVFHAMCPLKPTLAFSFPVVHLVFSLACADVAIWQQTQTWDIWMELKVKMCVVFVPRSQWT